MSRSSSRASERPILGGPRSASPALSTSQQRQATVRLGSPVQPNAFPKESPSGTPIPQNPLSAFNFPSGGGSPPRFGTPSRGIGTPPRFATPPIFHTRTPPVGLAGPADSASIAPSMNYGSFDSRQPIEDPEVVRRHLVTDDDAASGRGVGNGYDTESDAGGEFNSLQLQGGDITRPIYRYVEQTAEQSRPGRGRSMSFHMPRPEPEDETEDINHIKAIGGFRRDFLRRTQGVSPNAGNGAGPGFFTRNFIEFLTLHGHFAGEDLEDDEGWEEDDEMLAEEGRREDEDDEPSERRGLLSRRPSMRQSKIATGTAGSGKAVLLLLKSFVGTGVLFLPKAFLNGGMLFSNLVLLFVSALSYYCFVLLVRTRLKVVGGFGDIGGQLYGPKMRQLILASVIISQIGFSAAYIVFTAENLQAFVLAVSDGETIISIKWLILMQMIVFLPFSMIRDMAKLGGTALVADFFIILGLVYLYYTDIFTLATHGVADIKQFNPNDWTLFIGTAIFTFEGIGLIIPIQETMKEPEKFPKVLGGVMIVITAIFVSMGALCYAAYGSATKTVVILNLPQDNRFVNGVQFLYSLAILLSTPLQLFPAIRIMETGLFPRSGKYNTKVKWMKNLFRFCVVIVTAMISWGGADDLDKFVALIGSFACIPLVYIYPPLLHMRAYPGRGWAAMTVEKGLVVFGAIVMIYTTGLTVMKWRDPSQ
ncbi:transmembrane amino acid transporter protein-domain-containing protein [Geopyxis carbonaria]|nr:transmembrane amino acid transporter protein-domain-containing protein [Geopyxis carbonaria]